MAKKPKTPLTIIRTGSGDNGFTNFRNSKRTPKSNLFIQYLGILDLIQSKATNMLMTQDLIFALGANIHNPQEPKYLKQINKLIKQFNNGIMTFTETLSPLNGFIRTTNANANLMELRAVIRQGEVIACQLRDSFDNSDEMCYNNIDLHIKTLNILSDFIFTLAWKITPPYELKQWTGEITENYTIEDELNSYITT